MKLIVILLALGLIKLLKRNPLAGAWGWFDAYAQFWRSTVYSKYPKPWALLACLYAPVVLVAGLVLLIVQGWMLGLLSLLVTTALLMWSLGSWDWFADINIKYLPTLSGKAKEESVEDGEAETVIEEDEVALTQMNADSLVAAAQTSLYSVLFWFVVLGSLGALLMRVAELSARHLQKAQGEQGEQGDTACGQVAERVLRWIEWAPVRVTALVYILMGHFMDGFGPWLRGALSRPCNNQEFLKTCTHAALQGETNPDSEPVRLLIQRSMAFWLVMVALLTIVAWVS